MRLNRTIYTVGSWLTGVALLAGCAAPTAAPTAPTTAGEGTAPVAEGTLGGQIRTVESGGFYSLDPFVTPWFTTVHASVYDALVTTDLDKNFVPHLAESYEIAEDGLSITFVLREGITFHDGTPLDAAAVKWNLDRYFDPESGAQIGRNLARIAQSVETPDERTVVITTSEPYAPILTDIYIMYMVSPTAYEAAGRDNFGQNPVGTGEFVVNEIVPDAHVLFDRNEDYAWAPAYAENPGPVPAESLNVDYLTDEAVIFAALETGELNFIPSVPAQYLPQAEQNPDIEVNQGIAWSLWYLGFNWGIEPFNDIAVRQAIAYAVDREEIVLAAFEGQAYPLAGPLTPSITGFSQEIEDYALENSNNLELAAQLLADAGYVDTDGNGILEKDGTPLAFNLIYPDVTGMQRVAETIQAQLADLGIQMEISPSEGAAIADLTNRCEQQAFLRTYGLPDATILASMRSANLGAGNRTCLNDPTYDELQILADSTTDPVARQEAINDVGRWLVDNRPYVPLYAPYNMSGYRTELQGLEFDIVGAAYFFNAGVGN